MSVDPLHLDRAVAVSDAITYQDVHAYAPADETWLICEFVPLAVEEIRKARELIAEADTRLDGFNYRRARNGGGRFVLLDDLHDKFQAFLAVGVPVPDTEAE